MNDNTRAIVCVHYGGLPCDMDELLAIGEAHGIPVIEDAAQACGAVYRGTPIGSISPFTAFSFQAIKHVTTGEGGLLSLRERKPPRLPGACDGSESTVRPRPPDARDGNIREVGYR